VAEKFARRAGLLIEVFDTRPSLALPGYFHISLRDRRSGILQIVLTNGRFMIPAVIRVSPAREGGPLSVKGGYVPLPTDVLFEEQSGMFVGRPNLKEALLLGKGSAGYVLVVDSLWTDEFATVVDILAERFRGKKEEAPSLHLVPVFGLFSTYTAHLGRHFYALLDAGADPLRTAYALSGAPHEVKGFPGPLFQFCLELLKREFPESDERDLDRKLRKHLALITPEKAVRRSIETASRVGTAMMKGVLVVNDRIFHYPNLVGKLGEDRERHFEEILPYPKTGRGGER